VIPPRDGEKKALSAIDLLKSRTRAPPIVEQPPPPLSTSNPFENMGGHRMSN
jgi:hypothetical protein